MRVYTSRMTATDDASAPMRVWLLQPVTGDDEVGPWDPWYGKTFGFVVRATSELRAREIAQANGRDEILRWGADRRLRDMPTWTDPALVTCVELTADGEEGVVIQDTRSD